jgi:nicotinate-nucleotide pyrophosphorylase (carboxylating)
MSIPPLPDALPHSLIEPIVRAALAEDLGRAGDITSNAIVPADAHASLALVAREAGILAGSAPARIAFHLVDPAIRIESRLPDGAVLAPGAVIATIAGPARALLTAERTALNFMGQLSGVASATNTLVRAVAHTSARITDTRKTTPGLRALQKHAVRLGGGHNHRFGLDDAILIKDNHVALAGGIRPAIERARAAAGHLVRIELEVDTLAQLDEALSLGVDIVLLDNMDPAMLREAVALNRGRAVLEASGRVTPDTAPAIAETGIDLIAVGWITHSARVLDIGFDHRQA